MIVALDRGPIWLDMKNNQFVLSATAYTSWVLFVNVPYLSAAVRTRLHTHERDVSARTEGVPNMRCVICLTDPADAVCICSACVCPACLVKLLDRGRNRCAVCGSRFQPSAVVKACSLAVKNAEGGNLTKAHGKLAVAYSTAGRPLHALCSLEIALRHAEPNSRWEHFLKLENAQNLFFAGRTDEADRCLRSLMPILLQMPTSAPAAALYSHVCILKCKMDAQRDKQDSARSWVRRGIGVQSEFGLDAPLANSLQLYFELLSKAGMHEEAKQALEIAESIMSYETDEYLKCRVQVDLATTEVQLGQYDPAQARLSTVLPTLRQRKRDLCSADLAVVAARSLSGIINPTRRLRRKTWHERVESRAAR